MIWTKDGQKAIEEIELNDVVLSHTGRWRKVIHLFEHANDASMVSIRSAGSCQPLVCTENHPVRVCDIKTQSYRWIAAGSIKVGDHVVLPRLKIAKEKVIDAPLAELIAWFIAEGSVSKNFVQFSLNKKEKDYAKRISDCASTFGKVSQLDSGTSLAINVNSCFLADFLTSNCGSGAAQKRIPWSLIAGHERLVYDTLMDGDGCRGNYNGPNEVFTTISYSLALDMQMLAHMLGKRASVVKAIASKRSSTILGRECNISDSYSVRVSTIRRTKNGRPKIHPQKHGVAVLVTEVERLHPCEKVYNFSVQYDESYVANGRVVHNCSFDAAILGSIFGEQIADARMQNRIRPLVPHLKSHPVHTAWDLGRSDDTAIWFYQNINNELRIIDYHESNFKDMDYYINDVLSEKIETRNFTFGTHALPHDARIKTLLSGGQNIIQQFISIAKNSEHKARMGNPIALKNIPLQHQIQAARKTLKKSIFDESTTEVGLEHLKNYKREFDEDTKTFREKPKHDESSHAASAFCTLSCSWQDIGGQHYHPDPDRDPKNENNILSGNVIYLDNKPRIINPNLNQMRKDHLKTSKGNRKSIY